MLTNEEKNRILVQLTAIRRENEAIDSVINDPNRSVESLENFLRELRAKNNEQIKKRLKRIEQNAIQLEIQEYEKALDSDLLSDKESNDFKIKLEIAHSRLNHG